MITIRAPVGANKGNLSVPLLAKKISRARNSSSIWQLLPLPQYSILHLDLLDQQHAGQVPVPGSQLLLLVLLGSDQD